MSTFNLKVVTPEKVVYDGIVSRITVRTVSGDIGILKGHANYVAPLAIGELKVVYEDETEKYAAIAGGMISVEKDGTTILTTACEWSDEIDKERAERAADRARNYIEHPTKIHTEEIANIKLQRALNRINISDKR